MRFTRLSLSYLIIFSLFASNVQAIDVDRVTVKPGQSLADQLINSSKEGVIISGDTRFPPTPQKSRALQENKSSLDWTMPSTLSGGATSAKSSREEAIGASAAQKDLAASSSAANASSTTESELPPAETATVSVGGSWSFKLNDSLIRYMALALFQSGEYVYGDGNMREGNTTLQVAASGSVNDNEMNLDIISLGNINPDAIFHQLTFYKLKLDLKEDLGSGNYQAFSATGENWSGSAEGVRISAQ